jgi:hypothetical protein
MNIDRELEMTAVEKLVIPTTSSMRIEKHIRPMLEQLRAMSGLRTYSKLLTHLLYFVMNDKDILAKFIKERQDAFIRGDDEYVKQGTFDGGTFHDLENAKVRAAEIIELCGDL